MDLTGIFGAWKQVLQVASPSPVHTLFWFKLIWVGFSVCRNRYPEQQLTLAVNIFGLDEHFQHE